MASTGTSIGSPRQQRHGANGCKLRGSESEKTTREPGSERSTLLVSSPRLPSLPGPRAVRFAPEIGWNHVRQTNLPSLEAVGFLFFQEGGSVMTDESDTGVTGTSRLLSATM